jgi:excisionase family DNA binding protein
MQAVEHEWLTAEEIAETLKVHKRTVLRWVGAGALRGYRFGAESGMIRVTKEDLDRFLKERETRPPYPEED